MKTSGISSLKYLASKIHPSLPLGPRDSQKLLIALQSSFQQHLDREHPSPQSKTSTIGDNHLRSILASPLFNVNVNFKAPSPHPNQLTSTSLGRIQHVINSPMEYFKTRVAAGTATLDLARMCLKFQTQKSFPTGSMKHYEETKTQDVGSTVLDWLWSSGLGKTDNFLMNREFVGLLVPFVMAEKHEDLIWHWLRQLQCSVDNTQSENERRPFLKMQAFIVATMMKFETLHGSGLSSAIKIFSYKASEISSWAYIKVLQTAARYLMDRIIENSRSEKPIVIFLDSLIHTINDWSTWPQYHRAFLELFNHPHMKTVCALNFLEGLTSTHVRSMTRNKRQDVISLSLRCAEVLLAQGSDLQAIWVMDFLRSHFAKEIGILQDDHSAEHRHVEHRNEIKKRRNSEHNEELSLRQLDTLVAY